MKKKVIAILLLVSLVMPLFNLSASARYDGEILFRDIPWGSTFGETLEALEKKGFDINSYDYSADSEDYNEPGAGIRFIGDFAGFESADISLFFVDPTGKYMSDEELLLNKDDAILYKAGYRIAYGGSKHGYATKSGVNEDLTKLLIKLTYLYGDHDEFENYSDKKDIYKYYIWKGSNNTKLQLTERYYDMSTDEAYIYIMYEANNIYDNWNKKHYAILEEDRKRREAEEEERKRKEAEDFITDTLSNVEGL